MSRPSRIPVSSSTLVQVAAGVFIAGSTMLYMLQYRMQAKVRELSHYKETFNIIKDHDQLLKVIGKPIQVGRVDLSDRKTNYVDKLESKLRIPVSGPLDGGFLHVIAERKDENDTFVTKRLDYVNEDGTYLLYQA